VDFGCMRHHRNDLCIFMTLVRDQEVGRFKSSRPDRSLVQPGEILVPKTWLTPLGQHPMTRLRGRVGGKSSTLILSLYALVRWTSLTVL
jgi:hypothetical protein